MTRLLALLVSIAMFTSLAIAADDPAKDKDKPKEPDTYVKVEAKGKLVTGIMAIGGETTGVQIRTAAASFELEFTEKDRAAAEKLKDKTLIITGTLYIKPGVTRGPRTIIKVTSFKEAK